MDTSSGVPRVSICIDPGPKSSGVVFVGSDGKIISAYSELPNSDVERALQAFRSDGVVQDQVLCEWFGCYGSTVGEDTFMACAWVGRFAYCAEKSNAPFLRIRRTDVKLAILGRASGTDALINNAICDIYGGRAAAKGRKKDPGALYLLKSHAWSAFALYVALQRGCKYQVGMRQGGE